MEQINRSSGKGFSIVTSFSSDSGEVILNLEKKLLKYLRSFYINPLEKFDGHTECFLDVDILTLTALLEQLKGE